MHTCVECETEYPSEELFHCHICGEVCCSTCGDLDVCICPSCMEQSRDQGTDATVTRLREKIKNLTSAFVTPLMGACPTCEYACYNRALADADDCTHEDYDGGDPKCVDDWWEDGKCKMWKKEKEL